MTARIKGAPTVEERVQIIVDLMADLNWCRQQELRLSEEWGVSGSRVRENAAEASRRVKAAIADPEEIRASIISALARNAREARQATRPVMDRSSGDVQMVTVPDHNAVTKSLAAIGDMLGLKRSGLELTGKDGAPVAAVVMLPQQKPIGGEDDDEA